MNDFGDYLRQLRGKRSLREMERITGLSHTYLSTLEKGYDPRSKKARNPTPDVLKKLSETLEEADYEVLFEKAGYIENRPILDRFNKFIKSLEKITSENQQEKEKLNFKINEAINNNETSYMIDQLTEELAKVDQSQLKFEVDLYVLIKKLMEKNKNTIEYNSRKPIITNENSIENLLFSNEFVNYNGIKLTNSDKEKIINNIDQLKDDFTNNGKHE